VLVCDFARFRLHDLDRRRQPRIRAGGLLQARAPVRLHRRLPDAGHQAAGPDQHPRRRTHGPAARPDEGCRLRRPAARRSTWCGCCSASSAEDTGICEKRQFQDYLEQRTAEDGSDLADRLATLFHVLNTPADKRLSNLDEQLAAFPYINGLLFAETLPPAGFDGAMREALLDLCGLDWSLISPAIFGSLFQSIMDDKARRNLGAHYTSEANIQS
jgi:hypothetical protein